VNTIENHQHHACGAGQDRIERGRTVMDCAAVRLRHRSDWLRYGHRVLCPAFAYNRTSASTVILSTHATRLRAPYRVSQSILSSYTVGRPCARILPTLQKRSCQCLVLNGSVEDSLFLNLSADCTHFAYRVNILLRLDNFEPASLCRSQGGSLHAPVPRIAAAYCRARTPTIRSLTP
jgi:hypothetical protein